MVHRKTKQRDAILDAICFLGHARVEDLVQYFSNKECTVSTATIYRNLAFLEKEGHIRVVEMAGENLYESCSHQPHFHFRCDQCGDVMDIDPSFVQIIYPNGMEYHGAQVTQMEILFHGICPVVAKKIKSVKRKKEK